jgi:hypothetical protein
VVIAPGDPDWAVGLNVLAAEGEQEIFNQIAVFTAILRERFGIEHFGPRTEELLRNSLFALMANGLTLVELGPFLANAALRSKCLQAVQSLEIKEYFEERFEPLSPAMKAVMRDPVLNKVFAFTSDPRFRHILGQATSTFSFREALDEGMVVLIDLNKGQLGKNAATLGSLILTCLSAAIFRRQNRKVAAIYCDEAANLMNSETDLEVLFSESRKFGTAIIATGQYWAQWPPQMRAAADAIGTHIYFQLSAEDAPRAAAALGGDHQLAELLKNLPKQNFVVKTGHYPFRQVQVPHIDFPQADFSDLLQRSRQIYARRRQEVEREILARKLQATPAEREVLDDWE